MSNCALHDKLRAVRVRTADWPRCGRCDMPVENFWADVDESCVILVARCHGKTQVVEVPDELWDTWRPADFVLGPAFYAEPENGG